MALYRTQCLKPSHCCVLCFVQVQHHIAEQVRKTKPMHYSVHVVHGHAHLNHQHSLWQGLPKAVLAPTAARQIYYPHISF